MTGEGDRSGAAARRRRRLRRLEFRNDGQVIAHRVTGRCVSQVPRRVRWVAPGPGGPGSDGEVVEVLLQTRRRSCREVEFARLVHLSRWDRI